MSATQRVLGAFVAALSLLGQLGCKGSAPSTEAPSARESPQAKAEPAPLANVPSEPRTAESATDAGPPVVPLRGDEPVPPDGTSTPLAREVTGYLLEAVLRAADPPAPPKWPEAVQPVIEAARRDLEPRLQIELAQRSARLVLAHGAFVLPIGTELRGRADRSGFVVVLPGGSSSAPAPTYRVASPGSLRALFNDRRLDVSPLSAADLVARGEGPRRFGLRTRHVEVTNRVASAVFDVAHVPDLGDGGGVLCRALLDLMNAPPTTAVCASDDVPLRAELRWSSHGGLTFEVTDLTRRTDLAGATLAVPPAGAAFVLPALPAVSSAVLVASPALMGFRTGPVDIAAPPAPPDAGASATVPPRVTSGLAFTNGLDDLRFAWLDGVPAAWLSPGATATLPTLYRGRYALVFRSFLGDATDAAQTVLAPGEASIGVTDAGAR